MQTKTITYNVHERGRKHRGVDRLFDTVALARLINGPDVQERVRLGDMHGYYGHWPRVKFGMPTQETGVLDGKVVPLPLALRTIELSADDAGNITHRAEFLDTAEGRLVARLFDSQAGGFSSAIDIVPGSRPGIPTAFHGFDYVLEPNYTTNRGHRAVLDGIASANEEEREEMLALLDSAVGESMNAATHMSTLFDQLNAQHLLVLETLTRVSAENDILVGRLAARGGGSMLDGVLEQARIAPSAAGGRSLADIQRFRDMPLAALDKLPDPPAPDDNSPEAGYLRQLGMR